jgi:hypothetical protein
MHMSLSENKTNKRRTSKVREYLMPNDNNQNISGEWILQFLLNTLEEKNLCKTK